VTQVAEIVTEDLTGLRFRADGEAYPIAFVPEGADIPLPLSAARLAEGRVQNAPAIREPVYEADQLQIIVSNEAEARAPAEAVAG
jgi:hypothetical protein